MSTRAFQGGAFQFGPDEAFQSRQDLTGAAALGARLSTPGSGAITSVPATITYGIRTTLTAVGGQTYFNSTVIGIAFGETAHATSSLNAAGAVGITGTISGALVKTNRAAVTLATTQAATSAASKQNAVAASLGITGRQSASASAARLGTWSVAITTGFTVSLRSATRASGSFGLTEGLFYRQQFISPMLYTRRHPYIQLRVSRSAGGSTKQKKRAIEPPRKLPSAADVLNRPRPAATIYPDLVRQTKRDRRPLPNIELRGADTMKVDRQLHNAFEAKTAQQMLDALLHQEKREAEGQRALEMLDAL
jgi:hypothetical protein